MAGGGRLQLRDGAPVDEIARELEKLFPRVSVRYGSLFYCYDLIFISCNDGFKAAEEKILEALNRAAGYVIRGNVDVDTVSDDGAHLTRQRYCLEDGKFVCSTVVIERNIHGRK